MALKSLTNAQIVELTAELLARGGKRRKALEAVRGAEGPLGQLERAYDGMIAAQPPPNTALAKLVTEMTSLDARHDACVRALLYRVDSEIVIAETDEARVSLGLLRDALFPTGAAIVQRSYVEEAGEGKLRDARVSASMRRTLAKLKFLDGRTGEELFALLQSSARALGEGEVKRAALGEEGQLVLKSGAARNQWIRVVNSVAAYLAAEGIDEEPILGAIRAAEAAAERGASSDTDPGVTPAPGGDAPAS
ncbi:hypothetical protein [Sandaracinus amylolyticus]|uniref:hypothetical protein n=1 Tax=Sandaracinus amylolyticus TaxID=927083 RepID=UPI001F2B1743|nr:hypothetical protein [Sandaracinus amylolyticus]UJR87044.1 Hypothetical protein I5071_91450 [Sandaracinus amylolyticus]